MSLETWKAEFYPIPADEVSVDDAVQHSLRKWRGLTKENLEKHALSQKDFFIKENDGDYPLLSIDDSTCALCYHFINDKCVACPLFKVLSKRCDDEENCSFKESSYGAFVEESNPLPMIEALEKAAALEPDIRSS
jgi:hypothetical protein